MDRRTRVVTITVTTNDGRWLDDCLATLTASRVDERTDLDVIGDGVRVPVQMPERHLQ